VQGHGGGIDTQNSTAVMGHARFRPFDLALSGSSF